MLGLDTATEDTAAALVRAGEVVHEERHGQGPDGRPGHSRLLLPAVEAAVEAGGGWDRVGLIAVGLGPGTFTGIRIGIATARGLGMARGIELVGVSTLDALARGIAATAGPEGRGGAVVPVIDARRGEVFASVHGADGAPGPEPRVGSPERLAEELSRLDPAPLAAGSGALRFRQLLESAGVLVPEPESDTHHVSARHIAELGESRRAAEPGREANLEPIYLREPDAKRWLERDGNAV